MCLRLRRGKVTVPGRPDVYLTSLKIAQTKIEMCLGPCDRARADTFHPAPADTSAAKQIQGVDKEAF